MNKKFKNLNSILNNYACVKILQMQFMISFDYKPMQTTVLLKTSISPGNTIQHIPLIYYDVTAGRGLYDDDYPKSEYTDSDQTELIYEDMATDCVQQAKPEYYHHDDSYRNSEDRYYRNDGDKGYRRDDYRYRNDDYYSRRDDRRFRRDDYKPYHDEYRSRNDEYRPRNDEYRPRNDEYRSKHYYKYSHSNYLKDNNYRYNNSKKWNRDFKKDNNYHYKDYKEGNYHQYQQNNTYNKQYPQGNYNGTFDDNEPSKVLEAHEWQPCNH